MPVSRRLALVSLCGAAPAALAAERPSAPVPRSLRTCDDDAERPPFIYYRRRLGVRTEELSGHSVELLGKLLEPLKQEFGMELLPWKRCQAQLQTGASDLILSMTRSAERERLYRFSRAISVSRLVVFYDEERGAPALDSAADLLQQRLCLVQGVNYGPFGLSGREPAVKGSTKTLGQAFLMLKSGRCTLVPARLEGALGYRMLGMADYEQMGLGFRPVPGLQGQSLHFAVSGQLPQAAALVEALDAGLERLRANGEWARLAERYGLAVPPP